MLNLSSLSRRDFMAKSAIGTGLAIGVPSILRAEDLSKTKDLIRVGFIGCGKQHEVLFNAMVNIPGIQYVAACDIMKERLNRTYGSIYKRFDTKIKRYYEVADMLEKESLDAVFISTPDFWHSPHTIMALEAGCHVYCEKMMSNTLEGARAMVAAMDRTGNLCQIGHQRRSNPRYQYVLNELLNHHKVCGQIINVNGQWNRALSSSQDIVSKPSILPKAEMLHRYGFNSGAAHKLNEEQLRHRFLNWRFYTSLSGGPISDLGAHQIDIFNWYLGARPISVMASGGRSFFKDREHFDNVMCVFDYDTPQGSARAFYQVLTTTSAGGGYYESFMGTDGTIQISEREAYTNIYKESGADSSKWDDLVTRGYLNKEENSINKTSSDVITSYESAPPDKYTLPGGFNKPPHQPHIENFLDSIRGNTELTCDARHALQSEAPIYWVNAAAESKETIHFTDEHLQT